MVIQGDFRKVSSLFSIGFNINLYKNLKGNLMQNVSLEDIFSQLYYSESYYIYLSIIVQLQLLGRMFCEVIVR